MKTPKKITKTPKKVCKNCQSFVENECPNKDDCFKYFAFLLANAQK